MSNALVEMAGGKPSAIIRYAIQALQELSSNDSFVVNMHSFGDKLPEGKLCGCLAFASVLKLTNTHRRLNNEYSGKYYTFDESKPIVQVPREDSRDFEYFINEVRSQQGYSNTVSLFDYTLPKQICLK